LMSAWAFRLIFFGNSITSMPFKMILYVFMGSVPEKGGLECERINIHIKRVWNISNYSSRNGQTTSTAVSYCTLGNEPSFPYCTLGNEPSIKGVMLRSYTDRNAIFDVIIYQVVCKDMEEQNVFIVSSRVESLINSWNPPKMDAILGRINSVQSPDFSETKHAIFKILLQST
jgi:hypothetical protein